LIDSAQNLTVSANEHFDQTEQLLNTVGPLLDTQVVNGYGDNIKKYFADLADFTGAFVDVDDHFRGAIDNVRPAADRARGFLEDNENTVPVLARNGQTLGHLLGVYRDGLEQVLVEYPIAASRLQRFSRAKRGLSVAFGTEIWPGCGTGFKGNDLRNYDDLADKDAPPNMYCKIPHDQQAFVRGARNIPCSEGYVGMRAASVAECFGRRPDHTPGTSGQPPYTPPAFSGPLLDQKGPLTPADDQRNYQHDMAGGEPLSAFGTKSTAAPAKEESWQSILSAPLGS
jgi:phospholipid/cholesterol/gamma-HCH transport system substrate-binding protein